MTEYAKLVLAVDSTQAASASGDLKALEAQGGKTESSMAGLGKAATVAGAAIAAAAAATVGMVAASVQAADAAGEAAQAAGLSTEEFTRLKYAMQFDGSPENLGQSMKFLNKSIADAAIGAGNNAEMFAAMGVSIKNQDGTLKSSHDIMLQVADRFAGMEDGAQKAALAQEIFGKAGADMIPFLNNGAAGIAKLESESDKLGITINGKTSTAAGHLSDTFSRMKSVGEGMSNQIMVAMLPSLTALGDELFASATNSGAMELAGKALVLVLKTVLTVVVAVVAAFQAAGQAIYATGKSLALAATGDFKGAYEAMKGGVGDVASTIESAMARVNTIWTASAESAEAAEKRKQDALNATHAASQFDPAAALAAKDGGDATAAAAAQKEAAAREAADQKAAATQAAKDQADLARQQAADASRLERLNQQFASEAELEALAYEKKIADYRWYAEQKGIAEAETNATLQAMAQEHGAKMNEIEIASAQAKMSTAIGAIGDIAGAFASHSKTMFRVQKVAAIAQGMLSIQTGIANAMALPFPANLVAAAKVAVTGAGIMSNIKSLSDSGGGAVKGPSAGGGSLSMGGGASPSVSPAAAPAARQPTTDIRLVGIRPDDMISGTYLQKIIAGIGETLADNGGRMGKVELVMSA